MAKLSREPDLITREIGRLIRRARVLRGFSQRELASFVDLDWHTISSYEVGRRAPSWLTFLRIARVCDMPPSVLLAGLDELPLPPLPPVDESGAPRRRGRKTLAA